MALHFVRRTLPPYGTTPLDRARTEAFQLPFDEFPEAWTECEAWYVLDDARAKVYDMLFYSPDTAIVWRVGTIDAAARVIEGHLNLEDEPNEALERELARAIGDVKHDPAQRKTLLAEVVVRPELLD